LKEGGFFVIIRFMINNDKQYYIWVLGCQMNSSDAQRIDSVLADLGFKKTDSDATADVIVVVACSVRQAGINRIYSKTHQWQERRQKGDLYMILTGCVLGDDAKKLKEKFDLILPVNEIGKLPQKLANLSPLDVDSYFHIKASHGSKFQAYVPIMTGCDNYCSYCVVPYVRGREQSRPVHEIVAECRDLIDDGYKEVTLLGQNVNSYSSDGYDFPTLLSKIDDLTGDYWLRFVTSHPKDLSNELIKVMASGNHIMPYLHLPVQSGDEDILRAMNRGYSLKNYVKLVKKLRQAIPEIMLSTDVIVGFPGESKEQFQNTVKLFEEVKFDVAYISQYSERSGTAAARLEDDVVKAEKKRRKNELNEALRKTALGHNKKLVGQTVKVLVEGHKKDNCLGKTAGFKIVKFAGGKDLVGQFVQIKIEKAGAWGLLGCLVV